MKKAIPSGITSFIDHVFISDNASAVGGGKTALIYSDITAYYVRAGGALTQLTMVDITTLGTWDTDVTNDKLGFKKLNDTTAPGVYEIHLPDNIFAAGSTGVTIQLRATGAAPCNLQFQLTGVPLAAASIGDSQLSDTGAIGKFKRSSDLVLEGVVEDADFTPTTTQFEVTGTGLADATTNAYKDMWIKVSGGNNKYEVKRITASSVVTTHVRLTVDTLSAALADGDTVMVF
jgi:hypothetical protein